jgi:SAM-dependent MidA family methyltransferase
MQKRVFRSLCKPLILASVLLCAACLSATAPAGQQNSGVVRRNGTEIQYGWEIHKELTIANDAKAAVKDFFPSFLDYQDMVMFHPKIGYYSSGRVSFTNDYQTFPIVLAPHFGQMIAEQMYFMWDGMRKAGTLGATERFTIAEFGPGDGKMAESILDYFETKSKTDPKWKQFADQILYICYDRSPALNDIQRKRNERFGSRFAARVADATEPNKAIPEGSIKGVILSNELPDAFSTHKIILTPTGAPEVAFAVPTLPAKDWAVAKPLLPARIAKAVEDDDASVEKKFFSGKANADIYLTKATFVSLLENLPATKQYSVTANAMQFQEVYVPVSLVPELAAHIRRYANIYAGILAKQNRGLVSYVNLGAESLIQGSAKALKAGYVFTIDYGSTWDGILGQDSFSHFRAYGPAHGGRNASEDADPNTPTGEIYDPYLGPTLNDMTTDVNFSLLAAEGQLVGLKPMYYGSQYALQTGTSISLANEPPNAHEKYYSWVPDFQNPGVYKLFVQQKEGTDPAYSYPDKTPEPLGLDRGSLTAAERTRAADIEKRLSAR